VPPLTTRALWRNREVGASRAGCGPLMLRKPPFASESWLWTLPLAVVLTIFAVTWQMPFKVEGDAAYSMKTAQQFVDREVHQVNTLRLADPTDLSRDSYVYLYWWPPAVSGVLVLLLKSGLTIGESGRWLMFGSGVIGAVGSSLLIRAFRLAATASLLLTVSVGFYVLGSGMAREFSSADPMVFGLAPWIIWAFHRVHTDVKSAAGSMILPGLACGLLFWFKYSSLFLAVALVVTTVCCIAARRDFPMARKIQSVTMLSAAALLPVLALLYLNFTLGSGNRLFMGRRVSFSGLPWTVTTSLIVALANVLVPVQQGINRFVGLAGLPQSVGLLAHFACVLTLAWLLVARWHAIRKSVFLLLILCITTPIAFERYRSE